MKTSCDPGVRESPRLQRAAVGLAGPGEPPPAAQDGDGAGGWWLTHHVEGPHPLLLMLWGQHGEGARGQVEGPPQSSFNFPQADQRPCLTSRTQFQAFSYFSVTVPLWILCASHTCTYTHTVSSPYPHLYTLSYSHLHTLSHTHPYTLSHTQYSVTPIHTPPTHTHPYTASHTL